MTRGWARRSFFALVLLALALALAAAGTSAAVDAERSAEPAAAPLRETSVDQMEAQLLKFMMEARPSGEDQGEWAGKMRRTIERVSKEKNKKDPTGELYRKTLEESIEAHREVERQGGREAYAKKVSKPSVLGDMAQQRAARHDARRRGDHAAAGDHTSMFAGGKELTPEQKAELRRVAHEAERTLETHPDNLDERTLGIVKDKVFEDADLDKDGHLDADELDHFVVSKVLGPARDPADPENAEIVEKYRAHFAHMDAEGSGKVHHSTLHKHMRDFMKLGRRKQPFDEL